MLLLTCTGTAGLLYSGFVAKNMYEDIREGVEVRAEVVEKRREALEGRDVAVDLETPLRADDYRTFEATIEAWKNTDPFEQIKSLEEREASGDSESVTEQLRAMYEIWKAAAALRKLGAHYVETIEEQGGIEAHYDRLLRIGGVIAAAHEVAADHRFDHPGEPTSDAVADLLYQRHDEVLEAYGPKIDELRSGTHTFEQLAQQGELGVFALATVPVESYRPWVDFTTGEREALVEAFAWSVAAESLVFGGFAFPVAFETGLPRF